MTEVVFVSLAHKYGQLTAADLEHVQKADIRLALQDMAFDCTVHPEDLQLKASLGNVTAIDAALPDNNPYRVACQPRAGGSTSLIEARHLPRWPVSSCPEKIGVVAIRRLAA